MCAYVCSRDKQMVGNWHQTQPFASISTARSEAKRTKSDDQDPAKETIEINGFRQDLAASRMKQKWVFYYRVVNIDVKSDQHSEGKFRKSTDACKKTPTCSSVWSSSCIEHMSSGV